MTLATQLIDLQNNLKQKIPAEKFAIMLEETEKLIDTGITEQVPKVGSQVANFELKNQNGQARTLDELLQQHNKLVVTFYRGGWCPYCNLELRAYQQSLSAINEAGAGLVAITPELPDNSLDTAEKNQLEFEVLTDQNASYAKELGIVFSLPESLRPIYSDLGIDIEKHNGQGQFDLPLAATFIIGQNRQVLATYVDADYTKRKEPSEVINDLKTLSE
ncbi:putative peroxiredoxin family protein [Catenovulum agarivorans DS-2]|uniref:thioredoxin-dependent peroxiredoxin n=1 Tax=Catenovulum agarivorans DS-2 TaxID=1328313 RepID=W7QB22_9ALTE|nr:peroxiredoxin-like family protein [Catenovulum agarivorans]EWH09151.1 putative peroxiredoxin family protein [Catenovulum agarivorans DS-2]